MQDTTVRFLKGTAELLIQNTKHSESIIKIKIMDIDY